MVLTRMPDGKLKGTWGVKDSASGNPAEFTPKH